MRSMKGYLELVMMASILYFDLPYGSENRPIIINDIHLRQKHRNITITNDSLENKEKHQDIGEYLGSTQCHTIIWAMCNEMQNRHEDD